MNNVFNGQRRNRQQGMTTLGLIILVTFVGLFVYAGLRLVPVYLENMKISGTFSKLATEFNGERATRLEIQKSIEKRFDVEAVTVITFRDVKIKKSGAGYDVSVSYTHKVPFVANVSFGVDFNNQVDIIR